MEQVSIRKATMDDMKALLRFEQGVIAAERPFDPTIRKGHVNYYDLPFMIDADHIHLIVAEINGLPIGSGYARIEEDKHFLNHTHYAFLGFMYVEPEYRGKGVNKMIIDALTDWAHARGLEEIRLEVYAENEAAIRAYEKVGFGKH